MNAATTPEETKAALAREFPGWSIIWTRDTGRWWALRRPNRFVVWPASAVSDIQADTAEQLRAKLREVHQ